MKCKLNQQQAELTVSIVNTLIERYCKKYPDEYEFDECSIGILDDNEIATTNGDTLEDALSWVLKTVIPDILS